MLCVRHRVKYLIESIIIALTDKVHLQNITKLKAILKQQSLQYKVTHNTIIILYEDLDYVSNAFIVLDIIYLLELCFRINVWQDQ
jgi:hypothetical protein